MTVRLLTVTGRVAVLGNRPLALAMEVATDSTDPRVQYVVSGRLAFRQGTMPRACYTPSDRLTRRLGPD